MKYSIGNCKLTETFPLEWLKVFSSGVAAPPGGHWGNYTSLFSQSSGVIPAYFLYCLIKTVKINKKKNYMNQ